MLVYLQVYEMKKEPSSYHSKINKRCPEKNETDFPSFDYTFRFVYHDRGAYTAHRTHLKLFLTPAFVTSSLYLSPASRITDPIESTPHSRIQLIDLLDYRHNLF